MGRNKKIRKNIAGWEHAVRRHEAKIETERAKAAPDLDLIEHWENEIRSFKQTIERLRRRLRRDG
jgi:hypothetical protein